jgi:hypothetical protein
MKNKFVKFLSTGICCIMVSLLISVSMPQKYTGVLNSNSIHKIRVIIQSEEPPFL